MINFDLSDTEWHNLGDFATLIDNKYYMIKLTRFQLEIIGVKLI